MNIITTAAEVAAEAGDSTVGGFIAAINSFLENCK